MTKKYYQQSVEQVVRHLKTNLTQGLSSTDVTALQDRDGLNEFAKKQHTSLWQKFIAQFKSFMIIVLLVAAVISGVTGYMNGEGITDAIIILSILIVNAIIGVFTFPQVKLSIHALLSLNDKTIALAFPFLK